MDLHRPFIDGVQFSCPDCGQGTMRRVKELIDVWFDSGAMPVAQWHYPFENVEEFKQQFPADFICEAVDQTRGWFYSLLAISGLVFDVLKGNTEAALILYLPKQAIVGSRPIARSEKPW